MGTFPPFQKPTFTSMQEIAASAQNNHLKEVGQPLERVESILVSVHENGLEVSLESYR